ncbi:MAG: hypothetical protein M1830_001537 [Pleopsidium flavum]|nr:MAG: hypothetical protein M1830_001537 [Pleopsidium flavum]
MCAPADPLILTEVSSNNVLYATILVSIWELSEAFGPLLITPLSEVDGRSPVYHTAHILFVSQWQHDSVCYAESDIVGDMFIVEEQGSAMAIKGLAPLLGPVTGPIIGGYMSQAIGWRWTFWLAAIVAAVIEVGFITSLSETYKIRTLHQTSARLRKETGNDSFKPAHNVTTTGRGFLRESIIRPARILLLSPIIFLLAVYVAVVFDYLYLL